MSDETGPKIENLELNKETVQDMTEQEGDRARGGARAYDTHAGCNNLCTFPETGCYNAAR